MVWLIVALALVVAHLSNPAEDKPLDPNPTASFRIVALGDSYISGEGAESFFAGTDEFGVNQCHRAATSYPYLVAEQLPASLTLVACSGAETEDVTRRGQYPRSDPEENGHGARPQLEVLREAAEPDAVLISIGGNDAGFAEIGAGCVNPFADCRRSASFWLRRLDTKVYPALLDTFTAVREAANGVAVFALTYPSPIGPTYCRDILLSEPEVGFVRDVFVGRLNQIVEFAANAARIRVIDLTDSLVGHRICEQPLGRAAINFLKLGRTRGSTVHLSIGGLKSLANGTFHPNRLGHELISRKVLPEVEALRAGELGPLPPPPPPGAKPPPFVPKEIEPPASPSPFPAGTRCDGRALASVTLTSAEPDVSTVSLSGLRPGSTVCYRTYRAAWEATRAGSDGVARVPVELQRPGEGSINEILAEQPSGVWKKVVVSRLGAADEDRPPGS